MKKPFYKYKILSLILILNIIFLSACNGGLDVLFAKSASTPQLKGDKSSILNQKLDSFYGDINLILKKANENGISAKLEYVFIQEEEGSRLESWIEGEEGQKLFIDDAFIDSNTINLPSKDFLNSISDNEFLKQCLFLSNKGYKINLSRLAEPILSQDLYAVLAIAYENITGREIDFSKVNRPDISDVLQLKALSLLPEGVSQSSNEGLKPKDAGKAFSHLIKEVFFYNYGLSNQNIFINDIEKSFNYYHQFYSIFAEGHKNYDYWQDFKGAFNTLLQGNFLDEENTAISRSELASMYSFIYSEYFFEQNTNDSYIEFIDCEDDDASFCVTQGLMNHFPKSPMFHPEYLSKYYELPLLVNKFLETCFYDNFEEENDTNIFVTRQSLIKSYCLLNDFLLSFNSSKVDEEQKNTIINDRDYLWYERQHGTGKYADVNCMPTMTAMAIKWANSGSNVTTEDIRNLFLPDFTGGWWMAQVIAALDEYQIPHVYTKLNKDVIIEILNQGKIVLIMFSEAAPDSQGHCEVIYGYESSGSSLRFIVNDPGFDNKYKADGSPFGKARIIDGEYLMWTAERMNKYMVVINTD